MHWEIERVEQTLREHKQFVEQRKRSGVSHDYCLFDVRDVEAVLAAATAALRAHILDEPVDKSAAAYRRSDPSGYQGPRRRAS